MSYFVQVKNKLINVKYIRNIEEDCLGHIVIHYENGDGTIIDPKNKTERAEIMEELTKICFDYNEKISKNY